MRYGLLALFVIVAACDSPTDPIVPVDDLMDGRYELIAGEGTHPIFGTAFRWESGEMELSGSDYSYSITHRAVPSAPAYTHEITGTFHVEDRDGVRFVVFSEDNQTARVVGDRLVQSWRSTITLTWRRVH